MKATTMRAILADAERLVVARKQARADARALFALPQFSYMEKAPEGLEGQGGHVAEMARLFGKSPA